VGFVVRFAAGRSIIQVSVYHTLVMHDWGGPIGLGLAGGRPELIRRLVLGNPWAWPMSPSEPRGGSSRLAGGPIGEFVQMNFDGFPWLVSN
jgi:haloalkane dehalogenase